MLGGVVAAVVLAVAWTAWVLWDTQRDLVAADRDGRALRAALERDDTRAARAALASLQQNAAAAEAHTDGPWWSLLALAPAYGDDLAGVRGAAAAVDELATGAMPQLVEVQDQLDSVLVDRRVDLDVVGGLGERLSVAEVSTSRAADDLDGLSSTGYDARLRGRFDELAGIVRGLERDVAAASTAADLAPTLLGADGPRDYLVVFQNNAEVRATGGLSGAWARLHLDDGRLTLPEQGSSGDFPAADDPVAPVTAEEREVYGDVLVRYFQDPLMQPDFQRGAELFDAFWRSQDPARDLDGVLTVDVVGLSYLMRGGPPVTVDGYRVEATNVASVLMHQIYLKVRDPEAQDDLFARLASKAFDQATAGSIDPTDLVQGVYDAVGERRLMFSSLRDDVAARLDGTRIAGQVPADDGEAPRVAVTLNDATASKMSYFLDHDTEVVATGCGDDGVQQLLTTVRLRQTVSRETAAGLPAYITGGGQYGVPVGTQQVLLRIFSPARGTIGEVTVAGVPVPRFTVATIGSRQVITLVVAVDGSADVEVRAAVSGGAGQRADGSLVTTPGTVRGTGDGRFESACAG
ncbi:DUF4012 domain-containing protein [Nocardioides litoris]|uniref:DUF4012 domain-containing protein n=1 Tax=Nocardioides litoris TaxID=1926648 RepID=UPI00147724D3|nr:DUF4012 domain-containing protein [Nocardioides litoris]